jgi:hypothetical protein
VAATMGKGSGGKVKPVAKKGTVAACPKSQKSLQSPWLKVDSKLCMSCEQTTHDVDRDCPEGKPAYLLWHRKRWLASGAEIPAGKECYSCYDTRRRCFKNVCAFPLHRYTLSSSTVWSLNQWAVGSQAPWVLGSRAAPYWQLVLWPSYVCALGLARRCLPLPWIRAVARWPAIGMDAPAIAVGIGLNVCG